MTMQGSGREGNVYPLSWGGHVVFTFILSTVFIKGLWHAEHSAPCQEHQSKPLCCRVFIGPVERASMGQSKKKYTKQFI